MALVGRTRNRSAEDAAHALIRSVRRYAAGTEQSDDITVMIIDRTDPQ